jgi:hypothetical protein
VSASSQTHPPGALTALSEARPVRPIAELDVPLGQVEAELDALRQRLPLDDPDRHALDTAADRAFTQLVCEPTGGAV